MKKTIKSDFGEIVAILPRSLQHISKGIPDWCHQNVLGDAKRLALFRKNPKNAEEQKRKQELFKQYKSHLSIIMLAYLVDRVFRENARINKEAISVYEELGVKSFSIGRAQFSENSEACKLPEKLCQALLKEFKKDIFFAKIIKCSSMSQVAVLFREEVIRDSL
jgi:hypothetical protein